jgi:hypothetical protein
MTGKGWCLITTSKPWCGGTHVYGPAQHEFSQNFLLEHSEKIMLSNLPIMVGSDFNLIRFPYKKSTGVANRTLMDLFNCFIADMNLIEIHRIGPKFTWTNKQEVPIMEVLDRVLVSPSWEQMYPLAIVHTLSRCGSDHTPLLVLCAPRLPSSPEDFKTESSWFLDPSFKSEVRRHWPVRRGGGVLDYWHHQQVTLRRFMKGWRANFRGQHKRDKKIPYRGASEI